MSVPRGSEQPALRIAVIGHVEHVTVGRVPRLPRAGEIVHLDEVRTFPGGGGGVAFYQLCSAPIELHLFTAFGDDDAGDTVRKRVGETGAGIHAVIRREPHTRDVVMVTPSGERTIVVVGQPLHPRISDPLPWDTMHTFDAVYFTAQDPEVLRAARAAKRLIVTARRRESLERAQVEADVVLGSASDPREASARADYGIRPAAVVMTAGSRGGEIETSDGIEHFEAPKNATTSGGSYGAGDSFAGALTFFLACGVPIRDACTRAACYGAAVLSGLDPLEAQRSLAQSTVQG